MKTERLKHLLIPGQFRVWCRPNAVPGDFDVTGFPSKANCANCLTAYRTKMTGRNVRFRVSHTDRGPREWT